MRVLETILASAATAGISLSSLFFTGCNSQNFSEKNIIGETVKYQQKKADISMFVIPKGNGFSIDTDKVGISPYCFIKEYDDLNSLKMMVWNNDLYRQFSVKNLYKGDYSDAGIMPSREMSKNGVPEFFMLPAINFDNRKVLDVYFFCDDEFAKRHHNMDVALLVSYPGYKNKGMKFVYAGKLNLQRLKKEGYSALFTITGLDSCTEKKAVFIGNFNSKNFSIDSDLMGRDIEDFSSYPLYIKKIIGDKAAIVLMNVYR